MHAIKAHSNFASMPCQFGIGTKPAWEKGYAFVYRMVQVTDDHAVYVSDQVSEYGLPHEKMFIIGNFTHWYACEDTFVDGDQHIRQAVFRTRENFWERGEHSWETNQYCHKNSTVLYTDGKWMEGRWEGNMRCETRCETR